MLPVLCYDNPTVEEGSVGTGGTRASRPPRHPHALTSGSSSVSITIGALRHSNALSARRNQMSIQNRHDKAGS